MPHDDELFMRCIRCGRETNIGDADKEYLYWEATADGEPICESCVTPTERQAIDDDDMRLAEKVRENRLRRMAARQGLLLHKSRRRDTRATDYGTYMLTDTATNTVVALGLQSGYGLDLDEIEKELRRP